MTLIASISDDKTCRIWDVDTGECLKVLEGHTSKVTCVSFNYDNTKIITGSYDKTCKIWDVDTCECLYTLIGHTEGITSVCFSPDNTKIITGSFDKTCKIWSSEYDILNTILVDTSIHIVLFNYDGSKILISKVNEIDIYTDDGIFLLNRITIYKGQFCKVSFIPNEDKIIGLTSDLFLKIWDICTGEKLISYKIISSDIRFSGISNNSDVLAVPRLKNLIKICFLNSEKIYHFDNLEFNEYCLTVISVSSDLICIGTSNNVIKLIDLKTHELLHTLEGHTDCITAIVFSYEEFGSYI